MLAFGAWQFFFAPFKKAGVAEAPSQSILQYQRQVAQIELDSDSDGLKDWEETLSKTDPKNPDTDGDGTPDGEEIKESRDPTKAGPGDTLLNQPPARAPSVITAAAQEDNLTNMMGERLAEEYLKQKQLSNGKPIDPQKMATVLSDMLGVTTVADTAPFTFEDITIVADSDEVAKGLVISTANILQKTFAQLPINEIEALHEVGVISPELNSQLIASVINPYIAAYDETEKELLALKVPRTYARAFVVFLNTLEKMRQSLIAIRQADNDPALSFAGFKEYLRAQEGFTKIIQETQIQLAKDGIRFSSYELGAAAQYFKTYNP